MGRNCGCVVVRVLVTGCAGFIGSWVVEKLLGEGHEVICVDCFTRYYSVRLKEFNVRGFVSHPRFRLFRFDLSSASMGELVRLVSRVDCVIHEAAQPGVRSSWGEGFEEYVRHNVLATQRLLEACVRAGGVGRFVYASSSSVYGNPVSMLVSEDHPTRPYSPYGVTKLAGEKLCLAYHDNYGLPVVILRYFTVYGPRQRPDMAFHRFIKSMLRGEKIYVYGDGRQMRDFTYVEDVVEATIAACESGDEVVGEVINVGSGSPVSIIDSIRVIADIVGVEPEIVFVERKKGDVRATYADIGKARKLLGWKPKTKLREGLEKEVEWLKRLMEYKLV